MLNKQIIHQCRSINLYDYLSSNAEESSKWEKDAKYLRSKTSKCVIKRNGNYFFNEPTLKKYGFGNNAINFMMIYKKMCFADAYNYLKTHCAIIYPSDRELIYDYLMQERGLSKETVSTLIAQNKVKIENKNNYSNIVFTDSDKEFEALGLAGRPFKRRSNFKEYWSFGNTDATKCYICESAVDALSLCELKQEADAAYISLGGESNRCYLLNNIAKKYSQVVLAVDNDAEGDRLCKMHPSLPRMIPSLKDWNEVLLKKKEHTLEVA